MEWVKNWLKTNNGKDASLRNSDPEYRMFISDVSVVLWEITLTIPDSIETGSLFGFEIVRVVSLSTTEITDLTRIKTPIFRI